ncbi:MAG: hypothetical protein ACK55I_36160, partial [bacterium]
MHLPPVFPAEGVHCRVAHPPKRGLILIFFYVERLQVRICFRRMLDRPVLRDEPLFDGDVKTAIAPVANPGLRSFGDRCGVRVGKFWPVIVLKRWLFFCKRCWRDSARQ